MRLGKWSSLGNPEGRASRRNRFLISAFHAPKGEVCEEFRQMHDPYGSFLGLETGFRRNPPTQRSAEPTPLPAGNTVRRLARSDQAPFRCRREILSAPGPSTPPRRMVPSAEAPMALRLPCRAGFRRTLPNRSMFAAVRAGDSRFRISVPLSRRRGGEPDTAGWTEVFSVCKRPALETPKCSAGTGPLYPAERRSASPAFTILRGSWDESREPAGNSRTRPVTFVTGPEQNALLGLAFTSR